MKKGIDVFIEWYLSEDFDEDRVLSKAKEIAEEEKASEQGLVDELELWAKKYHLAVESEIEDMDVFYEDFKSILSKYAKGADYMAREP